MRLRSSSETSDDPGSLTATDRGSDQGAELGSARTEATQEAGDFVLQPRSRVPLRAGDEGVPPEVRVDREEGELDDKPPKCGGQQYVKRTLQTSVGEFQICACGLCRRGDGEWDTVNSYTRYRRATQ